VPARTALRFTYPRPDAEAREVAKKMLAVCVSGDTPVDWAEIQRLAGLPSFDVVDERDELKKEVVRELDLKD
jgi:hypothetical protein